jgi:ABC-type branched-subunit amino acid transport system ATPase component
VSPVVALETKNLSKRFGGLIATNDVSFTLLEGERHALIGPNGAGKTTFINQLTGVLSPTSGQVLLFGEEITGLSPDKRVRKGLARTFQINQLFMNLTPAESLCMAIAERDGEGWGMFRSLARHSHVQDEAESLIKRFNLEAEMTSRTGDLAYGKQRLLELALAFAAKPKVLLLDEPAAGVPEAERAELLEAVAALPREVSVLLIEHDMDLVFSFAEKITVLVSGALLKAGTVAEISNDPDVRAVYLGEGGHD